MFDLRDLSYRHRIAILRKDGKRVESALRVLTTMSTPTLASWSGLGTEAIFIGYFRRMGIWASGEMGGEKG